MNVLGLFKRFQKSSTFTSLVVLVIIIALNVILQPRFFSPDILVSNLTTFTPLILMSMAQAIIIIAGGIDLSIGASLTLVNVILAAVMKDTPASIVIALALALGAAIVIGLVNGIAVGVLRLPSMVATFATASIWFGFSLLILPLPKEVTPLFYKFYANNIFYVLPVPLVILVFTFLIWYFFKKRSLYRYIYAVGGNEAGATANGINTALIKVLAFILSSVIMFIAAVTVTAQTASGDAHVGLVFTLSSVAAAVIGGISLQGGKGTLAGAAMGACTMGLLINVIYFANIPSLYQELIKGLIIIFALGLAVLPRLRQSKYNI